MSKSKAPASKNPASKNPASKNNRGPSPDRRAAVREQQRLAAAAAKRRRTFIQVGIIGGVAVLVIAIVATAVILGNRRSTATGAAPQVESTVTVDNVKVPFAVTGSAVRVGPADAKARVDLWVDYSCPHCQEYEASEATRLNSLVAAGDVSVSYHNIQFVTDYGTAAGSAAACVATQDPEKWLAFNTSLYANHSATTDDWTAGQFRDFAQQQGVNTAALDCISAEQYTGWIGTNTSDAAENQVDGTPTLFLNGQKSELLAGDALTTKVNELAGR